MNILLLTQFFSTKGGGEYIFNVLSKMLAKNGHKVWIISNQIIDEKYDKIENVNLIFIPPSLKFEGGLPSGIIVNVMYFFNSIRIGIRLIRKHKISLIHSNTYIPVFAGSVLSLLTSKPHIIAIHDILSLCDKNYWKIWGDQNYVSKFNIKFAKILDKLVTIVKSNGYHTVSDATRQDIIKYGGKKPIHVIHNTIKENHRGKRKMIPKQFVCVGRILFTKNIEIIIRAISIISKKEPNVKLIVIGNGPHRKFLEELTSELDLDSNIEFKGIVNEDEKIKTIQESCGMVFPSVCEGFGISILEGFSCEKPVLVSNIKPMSDIVSDEFDGYVIDPYNGSDWADAMIKIMNNEKMAENMGLNGKKTLEKKYNQEEFYKKIISMYENYV